MKNIRTPRNLSDCQFAIGYPAITERDEALLKRSGAAADFVIALIAAFSAGAAFVYVFIGGVA